MEVNFKSGEASGGYVAEGMVVATRADEGKDGTKLKPKLE